MSHFQIYKSSVVFFFANVKISVQTPLGKVYASVLNTEYIFSITMRFIHVFFLQRKMSFFDNIINSKFAKSFMRLSKEKNFIVKVFMSTE